MEKVEKKLLAAIDVTEFYQEMFDGWDGKSNLPCPFPERHGKGEDEHPSFKVFTDGSRNGGSYCHGCGYKCTSPIYFYEDYKKVSHQTAQRRLWDMYIEKLVPPEAYRVPHEKLLENKFLLHRLEKIRGINRETVRKYRIGHDGKRLTIPVFNAEGWCVNIRRYDLFKDGGPKMVSWKEGYGSPRLFPVTSLAAPVVYIVEGELDALLACQYGFNAVTPAGGALTWKDEWSRLFKGKTIFIIPDNDPVGIRGAAARRISLLKYASSVRIVSLPVKLEKEDLTDWFMKYGGSASKLRDLAQESEKEQGQSRSSGKEILSLESSKSEDALLNRALSVWDHLISCGAFFKNSMNELFYVREGYQAMKVSRELGPFPSYLASLSPLINQATTSGKFIFQHVLNNAYSQSALSKTAVWTMWNDGDLFIHAGKDKLLVLTENKPKIIKNAINEQRVLLDMPISDMAITEMPSNVPAEGLRLLKTLFMDTMPMERENRYLVTCWLLGIFLRDYIKPKPIIRLLAKTASGKSTVSKLVSILIYGEELLNHSASTLAATYEMANRYPLLLLDNIETDNMTKDLVNFLLIAATGGMKAKRMISTDKGLIMEHTNCLVLTNGIEPFNRHELIDRTMEIGLDIKNYGQSGFHEARIFTQLKQNRQKIMSAITFIIHKYVLPRIRRGEVHRIMKEFGPHGKERFNEYFALMAIFLDSLWGYMPLNMYKRPNDLVNYWLQTQTQALEVQDEGTSEILYYLNTLNDKHKQIIGAEAKFDNFNGAVILKCSTRSLLTDFRLLARTLGTRCPWTNERQLGARLADANDILFKAGWNRTPFIRSGKRMYKFVRRA